MTSPFRLTRPAIQDIEEIADSIARESGFARADRFLARLEAKLSHIARFPRIGRKRDEILPKLRTFPLDRYLILYIAENRTIEILRVVSGYRDLSALFTEPEEE
ncbi:type II toxin-antitoxin system RelE/ParE family toxin [Pannus brasiliensis CCIBt3594]|uniref:Type II toxin-antitoxin system RelE/ParE family toxin n=1 Tax=Pannus brasiliensis CCIBt3594 TaxID=1427578 RepID=A0AAW9QJ24_9CHRO